MALKRKRRRERAPAAFLGYPTSDPSPTPVRRRPTGRAQAPERAEEVAEAAVAAEPGTWLSRGSPTHRRRFASAEAAEVEAAEAEVAAARNCHPT